MTCLNQKRLTSWAIKKTRGTKNSSPTFYYTCGRSCGTRVRRRRKEKHELVSKYRYIMIMCLRRRALTVLSQTRCICGPPRPSSYLRSQREVPRDSGSAVAFHGFKKENTKISACQVCKRRLLQFAAAVHCHEVHKKHTGKEMKE